MNTADFFQNIFQHAEHNSIIIMNTDGLILQCNQAFRNNFGYMQLEGQYFDLLFTEQDKIAGKPRKELQSVILQGSSSDDNYLVDAAGAAVWVSGESLLIRRQEGPDYIVKIIQNIHAQKQLERFLLESNDFLESIFNSVKDTGLLVLDSLLRILKVNDEFLRMFELNGPVNEGSRLTDINHAFWNAESLKKALRDVIVTNRSMKEQKFPLVTRNGEQKQVSIYAKPIHLEPSLERKVLVMIKEL